jgi:hypothetical protein
MKKGIEELIKESLQDQEAPYAPAAWEDMQKRLDKAMPVNAPKNTALRNFGLGLAGLAVVGTSVWYFNDQKEVVVAKKSKGTIEEKSIETNSNKTIVNATKVNSAKVGEESIVVAKKEVVNVGANGVVAKYEDIQNTIGVNNYVHVDRQPELIALPILNTPIKLAFGENVVLSGTSICESTSLFIKNTSSEIIYIKLEGKTTAIEANSFKAFEPKIIGNQQITLWNSKYELKDEVTINVAEAIAPNVNVTQLEYVSGLPTMIATIDNASEFENYSFIYKNKSVSEKLVMHPYKKGENKIEVSTTDANGCKSQTTHSFSVPEDYNLLAQTGLNVINNSFMPRALVDRSTGFTLEIIEIKTMTKVYKTSDPLAPWTGMQSGKTYIWTVVLNNPEPGEPREYRGELSATGN